MKIKVLSWNIWHGKHLTEVTKFLKESDADIIALQEVVEHSKNGRVGNIAQQIASTLGFDYAYYSAFKDDRHNQSDFELGNAVLSRFKIENSKCHFLSNLEDYEKNAKTEPRIAVEANININDKILKVFSTHLAYSDNLETTTLKESQTDKLALLLDSPRTVLMGDFNSLPDSIVTTKISSILKNADKDSLNEPTWTVHPFIRSGFEETGLKHKIDYIFVSPDISVDKFTVEKSKASDHLPISAMLDI